MYSILLAEDEKWVRLALRKVIEQTELPFRVVHEATNGMEAFDWLRDSSVDLVISDIRMPIMDGLALLERIREGGHSNDVIIVSGHDDFNYAQRTIQLGVFDYLLKPVEREGMGASLERWLSQMQHKKDRIKDRTERVIDPNAPMSPVETVIRYVESVSSPVSLTEAASLVHLNPSYFCKLFKRETGVNFSDYVTQVRMNEAARLLETTSYRVSEIADRLGYADIAYFSNTFKKVIGCPPSAFRKQFITGGL